LWRNTTACISLRFASHNSFSSALVQYFLEHTISSSDRITKTQLEYSLLRTSLIAASRTIALRLARANSARGQAFDRSADREFADVATKWENLGTRIRASSSNAGPLIVSCPTHARSPDRAAIRVIRRLSLTDPRPQQSRTVAAHIQFHSVRKLDSPRA
jgi:hypothetical protein